MAPNDAILKRSIRTIQSELEFLADSSLLTDKQLSSILAQLPSASTLQRAEATHVPPTQAVQNSTVTEEKSNGYYSPSSQPEKQASQSTAASLPPPPAYPAAPSPPVQPQLSALTYASALYAYKPSDAYDLELAAGDRIAITEYMNAEWWKGRSERTGAEGIFPRSYVRVEESMPPANSYGVPQSTQYANMPGQVGPSASGDPGRSQTPSKSQEQGKKFGKKLGNAAIFGAGATIGSNIVNGIF